VNAPPQNAKSPEGRWQRIGQLLGVFLKLGSIGFGGPAVHFATIEEETVQRRGWLSRQHYLDVVGATNLIPGPNSTEVAMHVGYYRAGLAGLVAAGVAFILPAALLSTLFAWIYVQYGRLDFVSPVLMGVKPAVIVVIFSAGWRLGRKALRGWSLLAIAGAAMAGSLLGGDAIRTLLAVSFVGLLWLRYTKYRAGSAGGEASGNPGGAPAIFGVSAERLLGGGPYLLGSAAATGSLAAATPVTLWQLALFFLKVGAVLYGTGYVLLAYLEGGLVDQYHWLTHEQLLDAFAVGNLTPGPILSTATFLGFILLATPESSGPGLLGALVATLAIFLPSFFFVAVLGPIIPKLRSSRWAAAFLDAVNAASIGLIAAVTLKLFGDIFLSWPAAGTLPNLRWQACLIAAAAAVAHFRYRVQAIWLVSGGGAAGWLLSLFIA
jgi:chromate transporter